MVSKYLLAANMASLAHAVVFSGAMPTQANLDHDMISGTSPRPTQAPNVYSPHLDFKKRQARAAEETCGWVSTSNPLACQPSNKCAVASIGGGFWQGCCPDFGSCIFPTTCYDYTQFVASACTGTCRINTKNLVCTDGVDGPYCQTYSLNNGAIGYACNADAASKPIAVTSAYGGLIASPTSTGGSAATGNPLPSTSAAASGSAGYLIPVIVVCVIAGLWAFAGLVVLVMCCMRHRKFMDQLDQQEYLRMQAEIAHHEHMLTPQSAGGGFFQQSIMMGPVGPQGYRGLSSKEASPVEPGNVVFPSIAETSPVEPQQSTGSPFNTQPQGLSPLHHQSPAHQAFYQKPDTMY